MASGSSSQESSAAVHARLAEVLAKRRFSEACMILLEAAPEDLRIRDSLGRTLLFDAAARPMDVLGTPLALCQMLVETYNFDISATDAKRQTPLFKAALVGNAELCNYLIIQRADVDHVDYFSSTALSYACNLGKVDVVKILLDNKAKVDVADSLQQTPLFYAASNSLDCAAQLLRARASVHFANARGHTPLFFAAHVGVCSMVHMLLAGDADVSLLDHRHRPAAFYALEQSRVDAAVLLLRHYKGVWTSSTGKAYSQAQVVDLPLIRMAQERGFPEVVKMLETHQDKATLKDVKKMPPPDAYEKMSSSGAGLPSLESHDHTPSGPSSSSGFAKRPSGPSSSSLSSQGPKRGSSSGCSASNGGEKRTSPPTTTRPIDSSSAASALARHRHQSTGGSKMLKKEPSAKPEPTAPPAAPLRPAALLLSRHRHQSTAGSKLVKKEPSTKQEPTAPPATRLRSAALLVSERQQQQQSSFAIQTGKPPTPPTTRRRAALNASLLKSAAAKGVTKQSGSSAKEITPETKAAIKKERMVASGSKKRRHPPESSSTKRKYPPGSASGAKSRDRAEADTCSIVVRDLYHAHIPIRFSIFIEGEINLVAVNAGGQRHCVTVSALKNKDRKIFCTGWRNFLAAYDLGIRDKICFEHIRGNDFAVTFEKAACLVCNRADRESELLVCDFRNCRKVCHLSCCVPALKEVPKGKWFCPDCEDSPSTQRKVDAKRPPEASTTLCSVSEATTAEGTTTEGNSTPERGESDTEEFCMVCGETGGRMLVCDGHSNSAPCKNLCHLKCCDPPLRHVPKRNWYCVECAKN